MMSAPIRVRAQDVLELVERLYHAGFADTAAVLAVAVEAKQALVDLTTQDLEAILSTLDEPSELRDVLLREHERRVRDELT
jgi:uncharacterized protein (DUF1778 family)